MSTGWSSSFKDNSLAWQSTESPFMPPPGLHCGPSGRATLLKWLEQNYEMKSDKIYENPGVQACIKWQNTQGFQDVIAKSLVDFLKTLGKNRNEIYKELFEDNLKKKLIEKVKKSNIPLERMEKIAVRSLQMLQVRQMQPVIATLLDKFDTLPESLIVYVLQDTSAARSFYQQCSLKIKRQIWMRKPDLFWNEVEPILENILYRLHFDYDSFRRFCSLSKDPVPYHNFDFIEAIDGLLKLVGKHTGLYRCCLFFIRLKFVLSLLPKYYTEDMSPLKKYLQKPGFLSHWNSVFISIKCPPIPDNAEQLQSFLEMHPTTPTKENPPSFLCECYYSTIRCLLPVRYKNMYHCNDEDIRKVDGWWNVITFTEYVAKNGAQSLESTSKRDELLLLLKEGSVDNADRSIRVKTSSESMEFSFILLNPLFMLSIIEATSAYMYDVNFNPFIATNDLRNWISLACLGLASPHFCMAKFISLNYSPLQASDEVDSSGSLPMTTESSTQSSELTVDASSTPLEASGETKRGMKKIRLKSLNDSSILDEDSPTSSTSLPQFTAAPTSTAKIGVKRAAIAAPTDTSDATRFPITNQKKFQKNLSSEESASHPRATTVTAAPPNASIPLSMSYSAKRLPLDGKSTTKRSGEDQQLKRYKYGSWIETPIVEKLLSHVISDQSENGCLCFVKNTYDGMLQNSYSTEMLAKLYAISRDTFLLPASEVNMSKKKQFLSQEWLSFYFPSVRYTNLIKLINSFNEYHLAEEKSTVELVQEFSQSMQSNVKSGQTSGSVKEVVGINTDKDQRQFILSNLAKKAIALIGHSANAGAKDTELSYNLTNVKQQYGKCSIASRFYAAMLKELYVRISSLSNLQWILMRLLLPRVICVASHEGFKGLQKELLKEFKRQFAMYDTSTTDWFLLLALKTLVKLSSLEESKKSNSTNPIVPSCIAELFPTPEERPRSYAYLHVTKLKQHGCSGT